MTREELASIGLNDEQINSVMEWNGRAVNRAKSDLATAQSELAKFKKGGESYIDPTEFQTLKTENEALRAEKETATLIEKVATAGVSEKFRKFVLGEVKANVTDKKDFDTALGEYLAENEQFKATATPPTVKLGSQVDLTGGKSKKDVSSDEIIYTLLSHKKGD